jgi:transcriptional regulator with XRE-family HTH domain
MLGEELRKAREAAGMTQEALAFAANIDRSYISQLENNHKSPTVEVLFLICDALGVAPSEVLARVEKARSKRPASE